MEDGQCLPHEQLKKPLLLTWSRANSHWERFFLFFVLTFAGGGGGGGGDCGGCDGCGGGGCGGGGPAGASQWEREERKALVLSESTSLVLSEVGVGRIGRVFGAGGGSGGAQEIRHGKELGAWECTKS